MKDALMEVVVRNPCVTIEAWIDDLNAQAEHEDEHICESLVTTAALELQKGSKKSASLQSLGPSLWS